MVLLAAAEASSKLEEAIRSLVEHGSQLGFTIIKALIVFLVGRLVINLLNKLVRKILSKRDIDPSVKTFVGSLVNVSLTILLIISVVGALGVQTTSFAALLASAGVAVGMALSGTLQNFAGGVLILLLKPYKIGDYIEVQGYAGTVREIQIFHTIITTYDNKSISIPNGGLSTGSVNNWSREVYRRVTWTVSISYGDNVDDARKAILDMFAEDERIEEAAVAVESGMEVVGDGKGCGTGHGGCHANVGDTVSVQGDNEEDDLDSEAETPKKPTFLDRILHRHRAARAALKERERKQEEAIRLLIPKPDHSPKVLVNNLGESSVDLQVRAWTKTGEYWNVFYYYNEKFYNELPKYGIRFPFPQMDVHLDK